MNKNEFLYDYKMKKSVKALERIDNEYTKADIDMISKGSCSYGAFLWQEKLVNEMKMYITYLGFIDSLIMNEKNDVEWDDKFNNNESKKEHQKKWNYYIEQRNKVLQIIKKETGIVNEFRFWQENLETIPLSDKFDLMYQDLKSRQYQLSLQLEFINSYNNGFKQLGYIEYERLNEKFYKSHEQIKSHQETNKKKVDKIRLVKKLEIK